jgi:hypothetical protein
MWGREGLMNKNDLQHDEIGMGLFVLIVAGLPLLALVAGVSWRIFRWAAGL